jgi:LysM repeat protein
MPPGPITVGFGIGPSWDTVAAYVNGILVSGSPSPPAVAAPLLDPSVPTYSEQVAAQAGIALPPVLPSPEIVSQMPRVSFGDFTFLLNPKETIGFGFGINLPTHQPMGGGPKHEWMGDGEQVIGWDGAFVGANALDHAYALWNLRKKMGTFTFGRVTAQVWLADFSWKFRRSDRIEYTLAFKVEFGDADQGLSLGAQTPEAQAAAQTPEQPQQPDDATPPPPTGATEPATKDHVVVAGDTLIGISTAEYGDAEAYTVIAAINQLADPDLILDGSTLRIPADADALQQWRAKLARDAAQLPQQE